MLTFILFSTFYISGLAAFEKIVDISGRKFGEQRGGVVKEAGGTTLNPPPGQLVVFRTLTMDKATLFGVYNVYLSGI